MRKFPALLCLLSILLLIAAPASAVPVTFSYQGSFDASDFAGVNINDPYSGTFTYDTDAIDMQPGDPDIGLYPLLGATFTTPLGTDTVGPAPGNLLQVNLAVSPTGHQLTVIFNGQFGAQGYNHDLRITDTTGAAFANDKPPATLALGDFGSALLDVEFFAIDEKHASGPLRTLDLIPTPGTGTPEPVTASLASAGLAALALVAGRRR